MPYQIDGLSFFPPVLPITDPSLLDVNNETDVIDLKIDVWVLPFLNLFGIYGQIDGDTTVDLSSLGLRDTRDLRLDSLCPAQKLLTEKSLPDARASP